MTRILPIRALRLDGDTQARVKLNLFTIDEYAAAMSAGATFPPVVVFYDDSTYWLADGFHRVHAAQQSGLTEISAIVHPGGRRGAVLFGVGANASHGLRRTNEDKRRAVLTLLNDPEWSQWSDREIARRCAVDNTFVSRLRATLSVDEPQIARRVQRGDATYGMNTLNIGERIAPAVRQALANTPIAETPSQIRMLETLEPAQQTAVADRILSGGAVSVAQARRQLRQEQVLNTPLPAGKYRAIVIDPPWPMEKILLDKFPQQVEMDYPTMTLEQIEALPINDLADEDGCHVYLWVTQKYLPTGLQLFETWGVKYQCAMTWVKPTGFTPFSWMYTTEHALFGQIGTLELLRCGLRLDFTEAVRGHSRKPDAFYQRVLEASPGPRLEMFARQGREGFIPWGDEAPPVEHREVN